MKMNSRPLGAGAGAGGERVSDRAGPGAVSSSGVSVGRSAGGRVSEALMSPAEQVFAIPVLARMIADEALECGNSSDFRAMTGVNKSMRAAITAASKERGDAIFTVKLDSCIKYRKFRAHVKKIGMDKLLMLRVVVDAAMIEKLRNLPKFREKNELAQLMESLRTARHVLVYRCGDVGKEKYRDGKNCGKAVSVQSPVWATEFEVGEVTFTANVIVERT